MRGGPSLPLAIFLWCGLLSCFPVLLIVSNTLLLTGKHHYYGLRSSTTSTPPAITIPFETESRLAPQCTPLQRASQVDFTLVTQLSVNRLPIMKQQCQRWGNHRPISIAVASHLAEPVIVKTLSKLGCRNIQVQVLIVEADDPYPVNRLRNLALANVRTSHAVYVDADFLVSPNLYLARCWCVWQVC